MSIRERIADWLTNGLISYLRFELTYSEDRVVDLTERLEIERAGRTDAEGAISRLTDQAHTLADRASGLQDALDNIQPGWDGSLKDGVIEEEHLYRGGTVHRIALNSHRVRFPTVDLTAVVDPDDGSLTLSRGTKVFSRFER